MKRRRSWTSNTNHVVKGELTTYIVSPEECVTIHKTIQTTAASMGLKPVITNPLQLLSMPASTFATNTSFIVVIHVQLVDLNLKFDTYQILSLPFMANNITYEFDIRADTIALQPGLASHAKHMLASKEELAS